MLRSSFWLNLRNSEAWSYLSRAYPYLVFAAVSLFISRKVLASPGSLGLGYDWSFYDSASLTKNYANDIWNAYTNKYLGSGPTYSTLYPFSVAIAALGWLGVSGGPIGKVLLVISFALAGSFAYAFIKNTLGLSRATAIWSGLVYMLAPYMFYNAISGWTYSLLGYALMPLYASLLIKAFTRPHIRQVIGHSLIAAFILFLMGAQIQFFALGALLSLIVALSTNAKYLPKFLSLTTIFVGNIIYALPWLLPLSLSRNLGEQFQGKFIPLTLYNQSALLSIYSVLQGRGGTGDFFGRAIDASPILVQFIYAISALTLVGLVTYGGFALSRHPRLIQNPNISADRFTITLICTFIGLLFFIKGTNYPLGSIDVALYQNVSFLGLFRSIYHVMAVFFFVSVMLFALSLELLRTSSVRGLRLSNLLALVVILGYGAIYRSGNYGGFVVPYKSNVQLVKLASAINNQRVLFLPNLQPYVQNNTNEQLGGWDSFQSLVNASAVHQGGGQTPPEEYPILRLNYCLIFDQSCLGDVKALLANLGIRYVVVRKDIASYYDHVTGIGSDNLSGVFSHANYDQAMQKLNLTEIQNNSTYSLYDTHVSLPQVTIASSPLNYVGGMESPYTGIWPGDDLVPGHRDNVFLPNVISENNRSQLASIERDPNTTLIEPGFDVDTTDWDAYLTYWWRTNYLSSGYNGIVSAADPATLRLQAQAKVPGTSTIWMSSSILESNASTSRLQISIPSAQFNRTFMLSNSMRAEGLIKIGDRINIPSGPFQVDFTSSAGTSNVDAIFIQPAKKPAVDTGATVVGMVNTVPDPDNSTTYQFLANTAALRASSESPLEHHVTINRDASINGIMLSQTNSPPKQSFIRLDLPLKSMPLTDLNFIDNMSFDYAYTGTNSANTPFIDAAINIRDPQGLHRLLLLDRMYLSSATGRDLISVASRVKQQLLNDSTLRRIDPAKLTIDSFSFYVNYMSNGPPQSQLKISNLNFATANNQILSGATQQNIATHIVPRSVTIKSGTAFNVLASSPGDFSGRVAYSDGSYSTLNTILKDGFNNVVVPNNNSDVTIESLALLKSNLAPIPTTVKVKLNSQSATAYAVTLTSPIAQPVYLNLNSNYDPNWDLYSNGRYIGHAERGHDSFNTFELTVPAGTTAYSLIYSLQQPRKMGLFAVVAFVLVQLVVWAANRTPIYTIVRNMPIPIKKARKRRIQLG